MTDDKAPSGWQPIETAPRDGTLILMWIEHTIDIKGGPMIGGWHKKIGFSASRFDVPTHWMPLPPPPESEP
jgi:hypothetical protein